ncbi:MAG: hypothetical protein AAGA54_11970 [Myxococcota bacterium]
MSIALSSSLLLLAPDIAPDPDRRIRVHLDAALVRIAGEPTAVRRVSEYRAFDAGPLSFGLGYQLLPVLSVGARVSPSFSGLEPNFVFGGRIRRNSVLVEPYAELRSLPKARVQPFVAFGAGVQFDWTMGTLPDRQFRHRGFRKRFTGRVGVRGFVLPRLSLEADVALMHTSAGGVPVVEVGVGGTSLGESVMLPGLSGALNVGASVWF